MGVFKSIRTHTEDTYNSEPAVLSGDDKHLKTPKLFYIGEDVNVWKETRIYSYRKIRSNHSSSHLIRPIWQDFKVTSKGYAISTITVVLSKQKPASSVEDAQRKTRESVWLLLNTKVRRNLRVYRNRHQSCQNGGWGENVMSPNPVCHIQVHLLGHYM